jgi:prepilin-type processing-associated H-X9-DG protein
MNESEDVFPTMYREAAYNIGDNYGEIYNGHYTLFSDSQVQYASQASIRSQLDSYIKSGSIWKCPTDNVASSEFKAGKRFSSYHYKFYLTQGYQPALAGSIFYNQTFSVNDFPKITQIFVFSEIAPFHDYRLEELDWGTTSDGNKGWAMTSKMNFIFADGHAKALSVDRILAKTPLNSVGYDYHLMRGTDYDTSE